MENYKGRILISMLDTKSFAINNGTELYYERLRAAYLDIKDDVDKPYLQFAFVTLCAATLEYSLNYLILEYCFDKYGPDNYKRYCDTYIGVKFVEKLYLVPTLLSDGQLVLKSDHKYIKELEELITLRNRILHNKESLEFIETPYLGAKIEDEKLVIPIENTSIQVSFNLKDNHIETLTKQKCLQYGDALGDFKTHILTPFLKKEIKECEILKLCGW